VSERLRIRQPKYWLWFAGIASAYIVFGKLGISLSVAHGVITPVWAPSGIALAALLIFGRSLWPAVALGAFLTNATSGASPLVAVAIACGNTLEPVAASYLLQRVHFKVDLRRVRDVFALVLCGAGLSTLVSATNGIAVLSLGDLDQRPSGADWLLWWFGDAVGVLMVTPFLLLAYVHRRTRPTRARLLEALLLSSSLSLVTTIVFLGGGWRYPYLVFPVLLWAALSFHQFGAAASSFLVGAVATWGTVVGAVPIDVSSATSRVQVIQALVGMIAISLLVVGATLEERETAKSSAEQTSARLSEAQALTHIGSWEWDLATGGVTWSDELYRIFDVPDSIAISSRTFFDRVHPEDRPRLEEMTRRACEDRRPFSVEYRILSADGRQRILHTRGRVIVDGAGKPVRLVGTAQDVTEQRHAETLRSDILAIVSHELRTPLASILNFAVILRERGNELSEQGAARMVDQVAGQARRIDRLLSDLLEIDRLRHGLVAPMREPTDVARLVNQIADGHRMGDRAIRVEAEPTLADLDAPKLERIVENLLSNAVKHSPPGTPITLRLEREEDDLLLAVDDEGPGIPYEHRSAVFDLFDRGAKAMSNEPGTGIGLALVARLAALHGGCAWVEDGPTGGASVRVVLPDCVLAPTTELAGTAPSR
jgi:signal transduction histidine kinase